MAPAQLTIQQVVKTIARLGERGGSRYTDIRNALSGGSKTFPTFFQLINVLNRAKKDGVVRQNAAGRWVLGQDSGPARKQDAVASPSQFGRRRRRKSKGGKAKKKGKKGKKGKGRRRRGKKGKKGKGKKGKKGKGRRR